MNIEKICELIAGMRNHSRIEQYLKFKYYFPPRPEHTIPPTSLSKYEGKYFGQPKLNGSCSEVYTNGEIGSSDEVARYFGRHQNENIANFKLTKEDFNILKCGNNNFNVIVGEYMNKSKKGLDDKVWNHKFVIFDILVYNGEYLLGTTFEDRIKLLDELFGTIEENKYLYKVNNNIYRVKTFTEGFEKLWNELTDVDMIEGWVLKKCDAKLEKGITEKNNTLSQLKSRKPTKNYKY